MGIIINFNHLRVRLFWDIKKPQKKVEPQYLENYERKYFELCKRFHKDGFTCVKPLPQIKSLYWEERELLYDTLSFNYQMGDIKINYSLDHTRITFTTSVPNILTLLFILEFYSLNNNHKTLKNTIYSDEEILLLDHLYSKEVNQVKFFRHLHCIDINDYASTKSSVLAELKNFQICKKESVTFSYLHTDIELGICLPFKNFIYLYNKKLVIK